MLMNDDLEHDDKAGVIFLRVVVEALFIRPVQVWSLPFPRPLHHTRQVSFEIVLQTQTQKQK